MTKKLPLKNLECQSLPLAHDCVLVTTEFCLEGKLKTRLGWKLECINRNTSEKENWMQWIEVRV